VITVNVELPGRSYPIFIGAGLLGTPGLLDPWLTGHQVMVVTNDVVGPLYLESLQAMLKGREVHTCVLPDGEQHKNLHTLEQIFDGLLAVPCERSVTVVALGGGVVGDIAGFAAACYQRGVPFIQVPTTLLAQVDSSVGGKTAVNHPRGKNMIGAFYQPRCVLADTDTLVTLDDRQLRAGLAEVLKYGLIRDVPFFEWIEAHAGELLARNPAALAEAIERSCRNKAEVVAADELEHGQRALLNLGHTFAHAIETGAGYGAWLHGEAVGAGMCMAADLSRRMNWLKEADAGRATQLVERLGLPTRLPAGLSVERMLELMRVDKKVAGGALRLVLLEEIGRAVVTTAFSAVALRDTLQSAG